MSTLKDKALSFAEQYHAGQMHGKRDYVEHVKDVAVICERYELPEHVIIAAFLHDAVEDANATMDEIAIHFGYEIACLVFSVTDAPGNNRWERKMGTYPKMLANPYGVHLKLADRIANVISCVTERTDLNIKKFNMYKTEHKHFRYHLKSPNVAMNMWKELDALLEWEF